jgi:hypothetical protein
VLPTVPQRRQGEFIQPKHAEMPTVEDIPDGFKPCIRCTVPTSVAEPAISRRYRKAALGAVVEFGSVLIQSEKCREHDIKFIAVFESAQNGDCGICYPCWHAPSFACR